MPANDAGSADPGNKQPTTDEKIDALHDLVLKMGRRFDSATSRIALLEERAARKDDDRRKDKDFKKWAEEEEDEDEHKDDRRAKKDDDDDDDDAKKDAEEEGEDEKKDAKKDAETDGGEGEEGVKEPKADKRRDAKKKDASEEGGEDEPEPMASDDRRRDKRKDDDDDGKRKDAKKDDDDCSDDRKDDRRDRRDDDDDDRRDSRRDSTLERRLSALERGRARPLTDADLDRLAELQHQWSDVAQAHGERPSRPMDGEPVGQYDRRMARRFQKHSERWKSIDLGDLPPKVRRMASEEIRADALSAAYRGEVKADQGLREIKRTDATGRTISEFVGSVDACLAPFKIPALRVHHFNNDPNRW